MHEYTCTEDLLSLEEVFQIVQQILVALKYCHAQGIAHNSLHEGNVLLMSHPNSEGFVVKLIGFSGSTHLQVPKLSKNYPQFREKIFRPPEGLMKQVDKKDIWAVGVILLDLLTGGDDYTDFLA